MVLMEIKLWSFYIYRKTGALFFLMITFQRDGFQVLRKTFLDCKSGKRLGEDFHLKGKFKKKYIYKFSKVNAPR